LIFTIGGNWWPLLLAIYVVYGIRYMVLGIPYYYLSIIIYFILYIN